MNSGGNTPELNGRWNALFKFSQVTQPYLLIAVTAMIGIVWSNSLDLAEIKGSRYTAEDAADVALRWNAKILDVIDKIDLMFVKVDDRLDALEVDIAELPTEIPPKWFRDEVSDLRKRVSGLEAKVGVRHGN